MNSNPNLVQYYNLFTEDSQTFAITEHITDESLEEFIFKHAKRKKYIAESKIWKILIQTLRGLHAAKISHGNMKSSNIFISHNGTIKIGPLELNSTTNSQEDDMWELGKVVYELCTLRKNKEGKTNNSLPKHLSAEIVWLVGTLLNPNPDLRPTAEKLLKPDSVVYKIGESLLQNPPPSMTKTGYFPAKTKPFGTRTNSAATSQRPLTPIIELLEKDSPKMIRKVKIKGKRRTTKQTGLRGIQELSRIYKENIKPILPTPKHSGRIMKKL